MGDSPQRWYVVYFKSKDDANKGINYTFGDKASESVLFPTKQAAYGIQALMTGGVTFVFPDGRKQTIYEFGVEKFDDYKYAIFTDNDIPMNLMASVHPNREN